jgi:hypothetical protein
VTVDRAQRSTRQRPVHWLLAAVRLGLVVSIVLLARWKASSLAEAAWFALTAIVAWLGMTWIQGRLARSSDRRPRLPDVDGSRRSGILRGVRRDFDDPVGTVLSGLSVGVLTGLVGIVGTGGAGRVTIVSGFGTGKYEFLAFAVAVGFLAVVSATRRVALVILAAVAFAVSFATTIVFIDELNEPGPTFFFWLLICLIVGLAWCTATGDKIRSNIGSRLAQPRRRFR